MCKPWATPTRGGRILALGGYLSLISFPEGEQLSLLIEMTKGPEVPKLAMKTEVEVTVLFVLQHFHQDRKRQTAHLHAVARKGVCRRSHAHYPQDGLIPRVPLCWGASLPLWASVSPCVELWRWAESSFPWGAGVRVLSQYAALIPSSLCPTPSSVEKPWP